MPLQNRVDPFGQIQGVSARGMFTGNRGVIHDPATRSLLKRRWTTKAWIICTCTYKDRPARDVMRYRPDGGVGWTELFFLDEVTALAAGHRPCFFCRRDKAKEFADFYGMAFGIARPKVAEIDAKLHAERLASGGKIATLAPAKLEALPDGTMVAVDNETWAITGGTARPWSFAGYASPTPPGSFSGRHAALITPASTVAVLAAGYKPAWHLTASR